MRLSYFFCFFKNSFISALLVQQTLIVSCHILYETFIDASHIAYLSPFSSTFKLFFIFFQKFRRSKNFRLGYIK